MFESSLLLALTSSLPLVATVNTFNNSPAIFSNMAPATVKFPYIVFRIDTTSDAETPALKKFNINIDYFDYGESSLKSKTAAQRIEDILNRATLTHALFGPIRCFFFSDGPVLEDDPRSIHHNFLYIARAGLKVLPAQFALQ